MRSSRGNLGQQLGAIFVEHGKRAQRAAVDMTHHLQRVDGHKVQAPANQIRHRRRAAFVRDMHALKVSRVLQQGACHMTRATYTCRAIRQRTRLGLASSNQLAQRLVGRLGVDNDDQRGFGNAPHGNQIFAGVNAQLGVQRLVGCERVGGRQQGVAISGRARHGCHADIRAATGLVVDDHGLAQNFRHRRGDQPGNDINTTGWRIGHHNRDRMIGKARRAGPLCQACAHKQCAGEQSTSKGRQCG